MGVGEATAMVVSGLNTNVTVKESSSLMSVRSNCARSRWSLRLPFLNMISAWRGGLSFGRASLAERWWILKVHITVAWRVCGVVCWCGCEWHSEGRWVEFVMSLVRVNSPLAEHDGGGLNGD
jgi:hypothetical protein